MDRCTFFRKHKFGVIQENGFQYCERCGKTLCSHRWVIIYEIEKKYDWSYHLAFGEKNDYIERVYECSICKAIKKEII